MSGPTPAADPSVNPSTGERVGAVAHSSPADVARVLRRAAGAADSVAAVAPTTRLRWLRAIAGSLRTHQDALVALGHEETGLGLDRLRGELEKAADSGVFYATVACEGSYLDASIEIIDSQTSLARCNVPVGPVAVFGASNFPFAFGVVGHDVASALSAGCPVIVKAHPAHPRLSVRLAALVREALAQEGAPDGTYDLVVGFAAGLQLVDAVETRAVAFTGSQAGGLALVERAAGRKPVFAEMGTVNPVLVTPGAADRGEEIARGFVASFTLGAGQFCTKPGLLLAPRGAGFLEAVRAALAHVPAAPLLTASIASGYHVGVRELAAACTAAGTGPGDETGGPPATGSGGFFVAPQVLPVPLDELRPGSRLLAECFGPVALVCEYDAVEDALRALGDLQPALAASVFTGAGADTDGDDAVRLLLARVGRVVLNAWPTGVTTAWSLQHGGPWPATSRPEATSVGAGALNRFVRPVGLQNAEPSHLPPPLQPGNPWNLPRRIDGRLHLPPRESRRHHEG